MNKYRTAHLFCMHIENHRGVWRNPFGAKSHRGLIVKRAYNRRYLDRSSIGY